MWHRHGGRPPSVLALHLALFSVIASTARSQTGVYKYPLVKDKNECTVPNVPLPDSLYSQIFPGASYAAAQGTTALNITRVCVDTALQVVGACLDDIRVQEGCCDPACADVFRQVETNATQTGCVDQGLSRLCTVLLNRNVPGAPLDALYAILYTASNLRKRCYSGTEYVCALTSPPPPPNAGSSLPGPGDRSTDPAAPSSDSGSNSQTVAIAAGVAGGVGALVIAGLTAWLVVHRHKKKNVKQASSDRDLSLGTKKELDPSVSYPAVLPSAQGPSNTADGHVDLAISSSRKHAPAEEQIDGQQTTIALAAAAHDAVSSAVYLPAPPSSAPSPPLSASHTNTGAASGGAVTVTPDQTGTDKAARLRINSASRQSGASQLAGQSRALTPQQSTVSSVTAPSQDEEMVFQRVALARMQIPWNALKLGRELGVGGFGTVYKGLWQGTTVAVKTLKVKEISATARMELRREALAMFEKPHPFVATIYGMVEEEERCALVMRYYRNGSVSQVFKNGKYRTVSQATRVKFAFQVATGMSCLHERNMLHGDLKTGNLLVSDDMNSVVITDFGLAGIQGQSVSSGALTVHISPPEVLLEPRAPRTQSCDVYAFGIVMLELLTGRPAFMSMQRDAIKTVVVSGTRPVIPTELPTALSNIISACWAQKPEDRPSFTTVLQQLETAIGSSGKLSKSQQPGMSQQGEASEWYFADLATTTGATGLTNSQNMTNWAP